MEVSIKLERLPVFLYYYKFFGFFKDGNFSFFIKWENCQAINKTALKLLKILHYSNSISPSSSFCKSFNLHNDCDNFQFEYLNEYKIEKISLKYVNL
jgi:hypothetical protein